MEQNDDRMERPLLALLWYGDYSFDELATLFNKLGIVKAELQNPENLVKKLKEDLDKTFAKNVELVRMLGYDDPDANDHYPNNLSIGCMAEYLVELKDVNELLQNNLDAKVEFERIISGPSDNYSREIEKLSIECK